MSADVYRKTGDRLPALSATLRDANSAVIDLTGWTVVFTMTLVGAETPKINKVACSITDAPNGGVSYLWAALDVDTPGLFFGECQATQTSSGKQETHPNDGSLLILFTDQQA